MTELAQKLMLLEGNTPESRLPSAIMGSVGSLAQSLNIKPRYRIGVWPCLTEISPGIGMGLFAVMCYLLEQSSECRVYRLFVKLEGDPGSYNWKITDSQFEVDDWAVDGLDENIAVWGKLNQIDGQWVLEMEIENDLAEEDESHVLTYRAATIGALVTLLPQISGDIADVLSMGYSAPAPAIFSIADVDSPALDDFLSLLFAWERNLFLLLWGKEWGDDDFLQAADSLVNAASSLKSEFGAWAAAHALSRAMVPGYSLLGELVIPRIEDVVNSFDSSFPAILLGKGLYGLGYVNEGYDLLDQEVKVHSDNVDSWIALADLYWQGGQPIKAIATLQQAIENDVSSVTLYMRYALRLITIDYEGWSLAEFVLIDAEEKKSDLMVWEAVEAYQAVLDIDADNVHAIYLQLTQLIDNSLTDERFWPAFQQLVELDQTGDWVRNLVDSLYNLEDISPAIDVLRQAVKAKPDRRDLNVNLAAAYLMAEDGENARIWLEKARALTEDQDTLADIDRMMLAADDPDFEEHLGELNDRISAGKPLDTEDVEFLEEAVEKAPGFSEGYILLGKAYLSWEEPATALETLLDGQNHLPDDPDILEMLGRLLWDSGQNELAMKYLNKGLVKSPNHVPILALIGQYLFESGQEEASKAYLIKAELISPRHPALNQARLNIARAIGEDTEG